MGRKGFTLVELLVVVVLLGLTIIITAPVILGVLGNSRDSLNERQIEIVEDAAERWGMENLKVLSKIPDGSLCYIEISDLSNYLSNGDIKDPKTGDYMKGKIIVKHVGNQYTYTYTETVRDTTACEN
ncbi:MAG: prepilin-type N-terminal cleavage/methylation domain-containing protein [Bacilli bacterium]|nr:prepilin-type N-terminal cleavage/methylation domain-containing protein [Bacilli bacterium]